MARRCDGGFAAWDARRATRGWLIRCPAHSLGVSPSRPPAEFCPVQVAVKSVSRGVACIGIQLKLRPAQDVGRLVNIQFYQQRPPWGTCLKVLDMGRNSAVVRRRWQKSATDAYQNLSGGPNQESFRGRARPSASLASHQPSHALRPRRPLQIFSRPLHLA